MQTFEDPRPEPPTSEPPTSRPGDDLIGSGWPIVLAALSMAAALIHGAAVAQHAELTTLAQLFAISAIAQGAWALLIIARPRRDSLAIGLVLNAILLGAYVASRTVGLPIDGAGSAEAVGFQDLTVAIIEAGLVAATAFLTAPRDLLPSYRRLHMVPAGAVLLTVALVGVPALAGGHAHGGAGHDAEHGASAAAGEASGHEHEHDASTGTGTGTGTETVSAKSQARADELVADTKQHLQEWSDSKVAEAEGFVSIGDGLSGFEHYINAANSEDPGMLDPQHPESLVYAVSADGTKTLASAMYIAPAGTSMDDVPDVAGAPWHIHDSLCWDESGQRLAGIAVNGRCVPGGTLRATAPMLHVWILDNECGPFADLENSANLRGNAAGKGGPLAARLGGALGGDTDPSASSSTTDCSAGHSHGS